MCTLQRSGAIAMTPAQGQPKEGVGTVDLNHVTLTGVLDRDPPPALPTTARSR